MVQEHLWEAGELQAGNRPAEFELEYRLAVEEAREAVSTRKRIPDLALAAVRAGARASIPQLQVAKDLGISKAKASELFAVVRLVDELADEGIGIPEHVSVSHLEVLIPLDRERQRWFLACVTASPCSVAHLRREVARMDCGMDFGGPHRDLIAARLGRWLRKGWERHEAELIAAIHAVAAEVPMGTDRGAGVKK